MAIEAPEFEISSNAGDPSDIRNITGVVSLPTGASTAARQDTGNTSVASIDTKTPTIGQKLMSGSSPVVIASDQSPVPSSQSGTWNINNVSGSISLPTGASTSANQTTANSSLSSIDTKLSSQATAANQTTLNTRVGDLTETAPATDTASSGLNGRLQRIAQNITTLISTITARWNTLGQKTAANSAPVVLASDQPALQADPRPSIPVVHFHSMLANGASEIMVVNGSVTPVNFDYTVPSGQTVFVTDISIFIQHNGTADPEDFGAIAPQLTNGVDIKARVNGAEYVVANIKNNMQLGIFFSSFNMSPGATAGWYNNNDTFQGQKIFKVPIRLTQSTGDYFRVTVRDNLTGINNLRMGISYWRSV